MRALISGERVTWTIADHGKQKKLFGYFVREAPGGKAVVRVNGQEQTTILWKLNRARGRKVPECLRDR